jgi:hypothetical protein
MPKLKTPAPETYKFSAPDDTGERDRYAPAPMSSMAGVEGYAVPWFVLSDRGTYFVPGSAKKTIKERLSSAPHLYQHFDDEVIGFHVNAVEDEIGFRIAVAVNEATARGAEVMSNHRFAAEMGRQAYQFSIGLDRVAFRTGTDKDEQKLNRAYAPPYWQNVPINELTAITEWKWYEDSTVTFAGIGNAQPDIIHSASPEQIKELLAAVKAGTLDPAQTQQIKDLVAAYEAFAAAGATPHGTGDDLARLDVASILERAARITSQADTWENAA